ncbi:MAG: restriction endonuclease subunit S [Alphaproteobacteria bacterium]
MKKIDTTQWKEFVIGDLFEVRRTIARSHAKYVDGDVPFVASGSANNGVVKLCMCGENEKLDKGNSITVSPLDGSAFYQPTDFLGRGGGSAILVLSNSSLNELNGLFLATVLRDTLTKYSYSDQLNSQSIILERVMIPSTTDGEPDWKYMRAVMKDAENVIKKFREII